MKNFVANGESLQLVDAANAVVGGQLYKVGSIVGVVVASAAIGEQFTLKITGAYRDLPKASGVVIAVGDMVYLTATNEVSKTAASNTFMGYGYEASAGVETTCSVLLSH